MRTITLLFVLLLLLTVCGTVLAGSAADLVQSRVVRLVNGVEDLTGWDCQYRIADTEHLFATLVWCEK
jgi:uncharacterized protein YceK